MRLWLQRVLQIALAMSPIQTSLGACLDISCTLSKPTQALHQKRLRLDRFHLRVLLREGDSVWKINHRLGVSSRKKLR